MVKKLQYLLIFLLLACSKGKKQEDLYQGHGVDSIPAEILAKYKAKPIDSDLALEIEKANEIRTPSLGRLTPDGKKLFIEWNVTGLGQVWRVDGPNAFPVQMTGGDDTTRLRAVTNDGQYIIVTRDSKGDEYPRLYLQPVEGGKLIKIYGGHKVKLAYLAQSLDGQKIFFYANDIDPTTFAIYEYDIKSKKKELLTQGPGFWWIQDVDEKRNLMIIGHAISNTATEFFLYDRATKVKKPLLGVGEKVDHTMSFATKNNEYFVLTNRFREFKRLYLYNSVSQKYKPITSELPYDITSFKVDKQKKRLLYEINDRGYLRVKAMNANNHSAIILPFKTSDKSLLHTYNGNTTTDGRYTIFGLSYHNKIRSSYVYDWRTKKLTQWTRSSTPELSTKDYVPWTLESYPAEDGTSIPMFVKRPKKCINKTCPVIVSFHGGPEAQSKPYFSASLELYAQRGFVFVMPNVRGSSGYGKAWLDSDNGAKRLNVITDIRDVARYICKNWSYDGEKVKIGVMGGSYGGYSSFMAMTMFAGEYDAGVPIVGMSSLITFLENTAPYRRYVRESEYGYLDKDREALKKLSAMTYIDRVKAPMLIIQGASDPRVPAGEAIRFKEALDKRGIESELIIFADEGHGVRKRKNKTLYRGHTLQFFEKHLK
jgi:dipeptidyl aminopeptidase/acylaminoacyl peptidase